MSGVSLVNVPWNLFLSAVLGVWLMASPYVLKAFPDASGHNEQLTGALVITAAVIAFGEVMRPLRLVNILFGGWLMLSPWILGAPGQVLGNDLLCGIVLISLSFRRGDIQERHGSWDQFIL